MVEGSVDTCNVDDAKVRQNSSQTSLYQFEEEQDEVFIGIVNSGNDELHDVTFLNDKRLAPSDDLFKEWITERDRLREEEGLSYKEAHNQAFRTTRYRKKYLQETPEEAFEHYASWVRNGDHVVFVCYCSNGCHCHRHIVKEKIHEMINE